MKCHKPLARFLGPAYDKDPTVSRLRDSTLGSSRMRLWWFRAPRSAAVRILVLEPGDCSSEDHWPSDCDTYSS